MPSEPYPYISISIFFLSLFILHGFKLLPVTSSTIPIVNELIGSLLSKFLNTAYRSSKLVSLLDIPYLPPIINGLFFTSLNIFTTSSYSGSPTAPASFALSNTAILRTFLGNTSKKYFLENGLNK